MTDRDQVPRPASWGRRIHVDWNEFSWRCPSTEHINVERQSVYLEKYVPSITSKYDIRVPLYLYTWQSHSFSLHDKSTTYILYILSNIATTPEDGSNQRK